MSPGNSPIVFDSLGRSAWGVPALPLLALLWLTPWRASAQARQDREGVTLYWGLVHG